MVQHARLIFYSLLLLVIPCESTLAQKDSRHAHRLIDNCWICHRKFEKPLRFRREDYGDTDE